MADQFEAQVASFVNLTYEYAEAVVKQAANNMINSVGIVPGINRGGSRVRGTIPRDIGILAASQQAVLYGSSALTGEGSHVLALAQMELGDQIEISWGGGAAPYARAVHYGAKGVPGTFWVDVMAAGWQGYVTAAVQELEGRF